MIKYIKNKQRGGTMLIMALLMMVGIFTSSLSISNIVRNGLVSSWTQLHSVKAYFAAEAGAEMILYKVRMEGFDIDGTLGCAKGDCFVFNPFGEPISCDSFCTSTVNLSNGSNYKINYDEDGVEVVITAIGGFGEVNRAVEVTYTK